MGLTIDPKGFVEICLAVVFQISKVHFPVLLHSYSLTSSYRLKCENNYFQRLEQWGCRTKKNNNNNKRWTNSVRMCFQWDLQPKDIGSAGAARHVWIISLFVSVGRRIRPFTMWWECCMKGTNEGVEIGRSGTSDTSSPREIFQINKFLGSSGYSSKRIIIWEFLWVSLPGNLFYCSGKTGPPSSEEWLLRLIFSVLCKDSLSVFASILNSLLKAMPIIFFSLTLIIVLRLVSFHI